MQRINTLPLLLLLLALISCNKILTGSSSSCCSIGCPESRLRGSISTPNAFKNLILNSLKYDIPYQKWILKLSQFPIQYTQYLVGRLQDLKQRSQIGLSSCSRNADDSNGEIKSFSDSDSTSINTLLNATKAVFERNRIQESSNFAGTYAEFIDQLRDYFNELYSLLSVTYTSAGTIQKISKTVFGMTLPSVIFHHFGAVEQRVISDITETYYRDFEAGDLGDMPSHVIEEIYNGKFNFTQYQPYSTINIPINELTKIYYYNRTVAIDQVDSYKPSSYESFRFFAATTDEKTLGVYQTSLQNFKNGDPDIFSEEILNMFQGINFSGAITPLQGTSGGYGSGQTSSVIWAKISTSILGPLLHCKYPGLVDELLSSCPATCDTSC